MKTEIIKIIEGGLSGDKTKVYNYTNVLIDNCKASGDEKFANRLSATLQKRKGVLVNLEEFSSKPVDQESRLDIVEILFPTDKEDNIILDVYTLEEINCFINQYRKKNDLISQGLDYSSSLLLYGIPGCGKSTLARYIAYKLKLPLIIARFDVLVSSLLGSTAKNIRKVFEYAKQRECILFLDEFDCIAKARDDKNELGELKRVVNSLLQNIDAYKTDNIIIAATNHQDLLDPAVWRRFDNIIELGNPKETEIIPLINLFSKDYKISFLEKSSKLKCITTNLKGFSHSAIKTITTNVIKKSIINEEKEVNYIDFIYEIYLYINHRIEDIDKFVKFMLKNNISQEEINAKYAIPLRSIRKFAKEENNG